MSSLGGIDFEKYKASILVGGLQGSICINYGSTAPMIIGFGNDLCDIRRIEASLARFGERFVQRCFTATERQKSDARAGRAASYAKRFAAKEACAKALGTGLCAGVGWRDTGVVNLPTGKPTLCLTVGAPMRWSCSTPAGVSVIRSPTIFASSLPRIFGL